MMAAGVLLQCLNSSMGQAAFTEVIQGTLQEFPPDSLATEVRFDRNIRDMTKARLSILPGRHASDHAACGLGHKARGTGAIEIVIQMPCLPPLPVVLSDSAKLLLDSFVNRNPCKSLLHNLFENRQIRRLERSNHERVHHRFLLSFRRQIEQIDLAIVGQDSDLLAVR